MCFRTFKCSYKFLLPKQLLALFTQVHIADGNFPSDIASSNRRSECPANDLMSKTYSNYSYPVMGVGLLCELDKGMDPRFVGERVVFLEIN